VRSMAQIIYVLKNSDRLALVHKIRTEEIFSFFWNGINEQSKKIHGKGPTMQCNFLKLHTFFEFLLQLLTISQK